MLDISVIIPAYNAQETIQACLDAIGHQSVDRSRYEIIVVDDGSTDATWQVVNKCEGVRCITQANQGPAAARNRGAKEAKGEILLFTDADCKPNFYWVEEMIKPFSVNPDTAGVKGVYTTEQKEIVARFVQIEYEDKYDKMKKDDFIDFIDTYSAAFKRTIFIRMGGYDTRFLIACAEDVEFSFRMAAKGYLMVFNSKAVVGHRHPASLVDYLKKKYKFAYWRVVAVKNNPGKAVKDSHTPQVMKLQVVLSGLVILSGLSCFICKQGFVFFIVTVILYSLLAIPFIIKALKKDILVGMVSPLLLFLRSVMQLTGIVAGVKNHFISEVNDAKKT